MAGELRYGKKGEDQWTTDLVSALNARGLGARAFPIYHIREGGKRVQSKPDFIVTKGGVSVGSAKLGNELRAFSTAQEYQVKIPRAEELQFAPIHETFAVSYPAARGELFRLHVLARPGRPKELPLPANSLDELADHIKSVVVGELETVQARLEPTFDEASRLMGRAGHDLADCIRDVSLDRLEPLFGGHNFFESVFAAKKELSGAKRAETLRLGAAFLFVNQLLFYVLLSRAAREAGTADRYPPISEDDAASPIRLDQQYFARVRATDYEPIYGIPVANLFTVRRAQDTTRDIVRAIVGISPSIDTRDLAGQVFQQLIDPGVRKRLGAHYTNPRAAELLADLSVQSAADSVLDPACGSGTLLVASYLRKRELSHSPPSKDLHKRFLEMDIFGIDAMAFAAHLAAVNLALQEPLLETDHVQIGTTDSTFTKPGDSVQVTEESLPSMLRQSTLVESQAQHGRRGRTRGPAQLKRTAARPFTLKTVDVVITNPPFTSWENMSSIYRNSLKDRFRWIEKQGYPGSFWWRMSQQAFFLLLADKFLTERGRLAAVLPFTTFTGRAFEPFVHYILTRYTVRGVIVGLGRSSFSEDTSLTECLFVAEKRSPPKGHTFSLMGTKLPPESWTTERVRAMMDMISSEVDGASDLAIVRRYRQDELLPWNTSLSGLALSLHPPYQHASAAWQTIQTRSSLPLISFSALTSKTGIEATRLASYFGSRPAEYYGASALVLLRREASGAYATDRLIVKRESASEVIAADRIGGAEYRFPRSAVVPAIRRLSFVPSIDLGDDPDYVVVRSAGDLPNTMAAVYDQKKAALFLRRLSEDRASGVLQRSIDAGSSRLCLMRRMNLAAPGTIVTCVRRPQPFLVACDGFLLRGLKEPAEDELLSLWFNSTLFLLQLLGRATFTEGTWLKVEDFILDRILVPDLTRLVDSSLRAHVNEAYGAVAHAVLPSLLEQTSTDDPGRVAIDDTILRLLGFRSPDERARLASSLREGVAFALRTLRETMGGGVGEVDDRVAVSGGSERLDADESPGT